MEKLSKLPAIVIVFILSISIVDIVGADTEITVILQDIDSGSISPPGNFRWRDVADTLFNETFQTTYNYDLDSVVVTLSYSPMGATFQGTLEAHNLKPNFAYQMKLVGEPGTSSSEKIGLVGRWWREEWNGVAWSSGGNLLEGEGDGSSPNPNDLEYFATKDELASSTQLRYKYTGYLVFDYFVTDSSGYALVPFEVDSSYHVLWKTSQGHPDDSDDGPIRSTTFDPPNPTHPAYVGVSYPVGLVEVVGEWERKPVGGTYLQPNLYECKFVLTEESFHGSGGPYAGVWAGAMEADITFEVDSTHVIPEYPIGTIMGVISAFTSILVLQKYRAHILKKEDRVHVRARSPVF